MDAVYPLHCYEEAIAELPVDVRDYTNAAEVMARALAAAARGISVEDGNSARELAGAGATSENGSRATATILAAAAALAVLAAMAGGYVLLRRRRSRVSRGAGPGGDAPA